MRILSTGYSHSPGYVDPTAWLTRIGFYTGILDELAIMHEVHSIEQIGYEGKLLRNGVIYHFLDSSRPPYSSFARINKYIKELRPEVVLVNGLIFYLQVIHLRWTIGNRVKIILLHRGEKPFIGVRRRMLWFADRCIDKYVFISRDAGAPWIAKGMISSERKIIEAMDASSVFYYERKKDEIRKTLKYLWVGRLDVNKDPLTVVEAFLQFAATNPNVRLFMIYQENELLPSILDLLKQFPGQRDCIELIGARSKQELQLWYNDVDFIVSGSHHEGGGIAVVEAMSCGCVPILTDIPSFRKITENGDCGILYVAGVVSELKDAFESSVSLNLKTERQKVFDLFNQHFSFKAISQKLMEEIKTEELILPS